MSTDIGTQPSLEVERRDHLVGAIARLVTGLHVPRSLGSMMVPKAYDDVRDLIGDMGWSSVDEVEARLRRVLNLGASDSPEKTT